MLGVNNQTGLLGTRSDGILGMAPAVPPGENAELFVTQLYEAGIIAKNAFGVDYRLRDSTSKIILGGYDTNIVKDESSFDFVKLAGIYYWALNYNKTTYGDQDIDFEEEVFAVLDTGTSLSYWPEYIFVQLFDAIVEGRTCGYTEAGFRG